MAPVSTSKSTDFPFTSSCTVTIGLTSATKVLQSFTLPSMDFTLFALVNKLHNKHSTASASYMYSICHIDNMIPLQVQHFLFHVPSPCYTEVRSTITSEYSPLSPDHILGCMREFVFHTLCYVHVSLFAFARAGVGTNAGMLLLVRYAVAMPAK